MKRLRCLDGLRGVLAVYVLLGHMAPFAVLPLLVQDAVSHGGAAVDLFFVLSGFFITQSLDRNGGQARPFLIARVARIFPVFLPVFAISILVQPWCCGFTRMPWVGPDNAARTICVMAWPHNWMPEILAHLTMTHGLFPNAILPDVWISFLGAAWSLSTEWQFYLLALLAAGRPRLLVGILFALAIAGAGWREAMPDAWQFSRAFLPNKAHFFALGVASLPLTRRDPAGPAPFGMAHFGIAQFALALAGCVMICATSGPIAKILPPIAWTFCLATALRPDLPIIRQVAWALRCRTAQYLGAISYCVYLVNEPVHKIAVWALSGIANGDTVLFTALWLPTATLVPILVSGWLHTNLEAPALRWGHQAARLSSRPRTR